MVNGEGWLVAGVVSAALSISMAAPVAAQPGQTGAVAAQPAAPGDPEADSGPEASAAVVLSGETVIWVPAGTGPYTAQFRAERIVP